MNFEISNFIYFLLLNNVNINNKFQFIPKKIK